jgi:hypothetical protein
MLGSLKSILTAAITTAITVCVTIFVTLWVNGPSNTPDPTVEVKWLELPKLSYSPLDIKELERAGPQLAKLLGTEKVPDVLNDMRYGRAALVELEITNKSTRRTKAIEVIGEKISVAALTEPSTGAETTAIWKEPGPLKVRPLAPGERARVLVLLQSVTTIRWDMPLRVLHDGQLVKPTFATLRDKDDIFGLIPIFVRISPLVEIYLLVSGSFLIFLIIFWIWHSANRNNLPAMMKITGAAELARAAELVDYVRKEHPEKLPVGLRKAPEIPASKTSEDVSLLPSPSKPSPTPAA